MLTEQNVADIERHLYIDEYFIKSVMAKEVLALREVINETLTDAKKPAWSNNVKIEKKLSDDCSWPTDEKELTNQEEKDVEQLYGCFKDSLLKVKSRTELNDFMLLNKRYITELFETRLYTIRTQLLIGKLRSAAKAISVVNAFRFSKKSS